MPSLLNDSPNLPNNHQVVGEPNNFPEAARVAGRLRNEYVVRIEGKLRLRKDPNAKLATGKVELVAENITVLNTVSKLLPFPVSGGDEVEAPREELRLRHRVLDLRWGSIFGCLSVLSMTALC